MLSDIYKSKMAATTEKVFSVAVVFCMFGCATAFASEISDDWYNSDVSLAGVIETSRVWLTSICKIILLLASIGAAGFMIFNIIEGSPEAAKRIGMWLGGLLIGMTVLTVFGNVGLSSGGEGLSAGEFSSLKSMVRSTLMAILSVVSIVTVVQKVIQLINGEKEGGRGLFKWFLVSIIGQIFLGLL